MIYFNGKLRGEFLHYNLKAGTIFVEIKINILKFIYRVHIHTQILPKHNVSCGSSESIYGVFNYKEIFFQVLQKMFFSFVNPSCQILI